MAEIYGLIDPRDGMIRYIGKANNAMRRFASHKRDSIRRKTPVYAWLNKLSAIGLEPDLIVLSEVDQSEWPTEERRLIASARRQLLPLLNVADGGDQPYCPEETRKANATRQNSERAADPFKYAAHAFLRQGGQNLLFMNRSCAEPERIARLTATLDRLKSIDNDLLAFALATIPSAIHFFPEWSRDLVREAFHD